MEAEGLVKKNFPVSAIHLHAQELPVFGIRTGFYNGLRRDAFCIVYKDQATIYFVRDLVQGVRPALQAIH